VTVTPRIPAKKEGRVVVVIDGDTIDVDIDGMAYRVHYLGIDAPEQGMPFYQEAKDANADLVAGEMVTLVKDVSETDQFDRLLRYVYLENGRMVNAELVRLGYARQASNPPDVTHDDLFLRLMVQARASEVGLWANPSTDSPAPQTNTPLPIPTRTPTSLPTNTPIP
jgi:micrococcal nuclease